MLFFITLHTTASIGAAGAAGGELGAEWTGNGDIGKFLGATAGLIASGNGNDADSVNTAYALADNAVENNFSLVLPAPQLEAQMQQVESLIEACAADAACKIRMDAADDAFEKVKIAAEYGSMAVGAAGVARAGAKSTATFGSLVAEKGLLGAVASLGNTAIQGAKGLIDSAGSAIKGAFGKGDGAKGWLKNHEKVNGGHTIQRHVGKSDEYLIDRLNNPSKYVPEQDYIRAASSYKNQDVAEKIISESINQNRAQIQKWLRGGPDKTIDISYTGNKTIGRGISKGQSTVTNKTDAITILRKDGKGGFTVLTSYPK